MFIGMHALAAMQLKAPELAITDDEGREFLRAAQNVARHYSVETTQKALDWIAFSGIALQMYGTRAFALAMRRREERIAAPRGQVVRFPVAGAAHAPPPAAGPSVPQPDIVLEVGEEHEGF